MRNVIFDLGGVVVRWDVDAILADFYADETLRQSARGQIFDHPDWLAMDRGDFDETTAAKRFHLRSGRPLTEMRQLLHRVKLSLQPIPETIELLTELDQAGVPLYCLSNMPSTTFAFLQEKYAFWHLFRGTVISGQIGMVKPHDEIFHHIRDRYRLDPSSTIFIDDNQPNVDRAARLGFHVIRFENPLQCRRELDPLLRP